MGDKHMGHSIIKYYDNYDEESRLFKDNTHRLEWITTMAYFEKMIPAHSYILDGCAGTGNYAFKLAELGHTVVASDIVPNNVELISEKQNQNPILNDIHVGDICDLSRYDQETFDVVLCMGAFYHIDKLAREQAMKECLRVLKKDGLLAIAYINNMAVTTMSIGNQLENMDDVLKCQKAQTINHLFLHMTPDEIESMASEYNTTIRAHVGVDGIHYLLSDKINNATEDHFNKYVELHLRTCEDRSILGYSNHALIFLQKQ